MESATASLSQNHNNTSDILVKICLHVLGLWINAEPTTFNHSTNQQTQTPIPVKDVETRTYQKEEIRAQAAEENNNLLGKTRISLWHRCMWKLDNCIWIGPPLAVILFFIFDLGFYLKCAWGRSEYILHLVTYSTYSMELAAITFICLCTSLQLRYNNAFSLNLTGIFGKDSLLEHFQFAKCRTSCLEMSQFLLVLIWPVVNLTFGFYNYATIERIYSPTPKYMLIARIMAAFGFMMYGCLAYLCYKVRKSFIRRFNDVSDEITTLSENEGKSKICQVYFMYKDFRDFVGYWMTFALPVSMLGLSSLISWHFGYNKDGKQGDSDAMLSYALMIWSHKLMFLLYPLLVFGGMNVDYLWDEFKESIAKQLMAPDTVGAKFHRIMRHMRYLNDPRDWFISTSVFSIIGFYFGINLTHQHFMFWLGPDCQSYLNGSIIIPS